MGNQRLDLLGEMCPIPILKAQKALEKMPAQDTLTVLTDHSCVETNLRETFTRKGYHVFSNEVMNGIWEIEIRKEV